MKSETFLDSKWINHRRCSRSEGFWSHQAFPKYFFYKFIQFLPLLPIKIGPFKHEGCTEEDVLIWKKAPNLARQRWIPRNYGFTWIFESKSRVPSTRSLLIHSGRRPWVCTLQLQWDIFSACSMTFQSCDLCCRCGPNCCWYELHALEPSTNFSIAINQRQSPNF